MRMFTNSPVLTACNVMPLSRSWWCHVLLAPEHERCKQVAGGMFSEKYRAKGITHRIKRNIV